MVVDFLWVFTLTSSALYLVVFFFGLWQEIKDGDKYEEA